MDLRPYQIKALECVRNELRAGKKRVLLVAPTGSGKTVVASKIIESAVTKSSRVLFVAHRREIIYQTSKKLADIGVEHGLILNGHRPSLMAPVHVASIQTLIRRDHPEANLVIFDEAHHVSAKSYQSVIEKYPNVTILGLTATPCRRDGKGLGATFDSIVQVAQVKDLVEQNYLVPFVAYAPSKPDLKGVKVKMGDYVEDELAKAVDKPQLIGDITEHWYKLAKDRQTIVFCASIAHSNHLTDSFRSIGVKVAHLDGETPKERREEILNDLSGGNIQVVCNVGVLTEGYDCPVVSCIVLARPTKSYGLFLQMAGRGMRPFLGKSDLLLLDHAGAIYEHGMIDADVLWSLEPGKLSWETKKYEKKTAMPWICDHCHFVNEPTRDKHCAKCGLKPVETKQIAVAPGHLQRVREKAKHEPRPGDEAKIWKDCFWKSVRLGLKVGAAAHMYRKKTGKWPRGFELMPREREHWQMPADVYYQTVVKGYAADRKATFAS